MSIVGTLTGLKVILPPKLCPQPNTPPLPSTAKQWLSPHTASMYIRSGSDTMCGSKLSVCVMPLPSCPWVPEPHVST